VLALRACEGRRGTSPGRPRNRSRRFALSSESKGQVVTVLALRACEGRRGTTPGRPGQDVLKGQKSLALSSESKGQVVTVLAMRVCEGSRGTSPFLSTPVLNGGEWSDSGHCGLNPWDTATVPTE
jgi:hypothetical protein